METETHIEVTEAHTDALGHLNHVRAVRYLELARDEWLSACGLFDSASGTRYASVVVNVNYNYKRECFLGEQLRVTSRPKYMGNKSYTMTHEIIKPSGEVAIDGEATSVVMDMNQRTIIAVPPCMAVYLPRRT
ncbi:MAG: acyl-CoA thioester hydrolase [Gammaproteobacteria bacterium]|jgi:acyl-CoA thioester hydrolase